MNLSAILPPLLMGSVFKTIHRHRVAVESESDRNLIGFMAFTLLHKAADHVHMVCQN